MVTGMLNYGRNGVHDWVTQRFSALILAIYTLIIVIWLVLNGSDLTFMQWRDFMGQTWIRIFTFFSILALAGHAWIGIWTVATDYIKSNRVRNSVLGIVAISLGVYVTFGISILWRF